MQTIDTGLNSKFNLYMPYWIYKKLVRSKINIIDRNWVEKISEVLSVEDLAMLVFLNSCFDKHLLYYYDFATKFKIEFDRLKFLVADFEQTTQYQFSDAVRNNISAAIVSGEISDQLDIRLFEKLDVVPYTFLKTTYGVITILNPTFGYVLKSNENKIDYFRELLNLTNFDSSVYRDVSEYLTLLSKA